MKRKNTTYLLGNAFEFLRYLNLKGIAYCSLHKKFKYIKLISIETENFLRMLSYFVTYSIAIMSILLH